MDETIRNVSVYAIKKGISMKRTSIGLLLAASGSLASNAAAQSANVSTSPDEVRAVVAEMLSDADSRTSLLADTSGHDGKFFLASGDGNFRLNVDGLLQFRYYANFRSDDNTVGDDDFETGFQNQNTKLRFSGNVVDDKWIYNIEMNFDHDGGGAVLEDAYVGYKLAPEWLVLFGQLKAPVLREWLVDDRHQLAVGRSITQQAFNHGRSQAVALAYTGADFMAIGVFSDGASSANTDFTSSAEADWSFSGRAGWKFAGEWSAFNDFTSFKGSKFAGMLGAAGHYQGSANSDNPGDTDAKVLLYTVDAQFEATAGTPSARSSDATPSFAPPEARRRSTTSASSCRAVSSSIRRTRSSRGTTWSFLMTIAARALIPSAR